MSLVPLFSAVAANAGLDFSLPIKRVIDSYWYVLGEEVVSFESEFAKYVGVSNCVSLANGTDALELALRGLDVKKGDQVVSVANAGFYGSTAIHAIGAIPLYVDVDDKTLTMSVDALAKALKQKPKAVIVTHLYGQLADVEELVRMTSEAGIPLIEDCAQSNGATRNGRQAGSFGKIACFSFYPTKNLGALGDGGAITTNDGDLTARIRALRQYGWSQKYQVTTEGGRNSRLDEIQAAILREKLPHLAYWNNERRRIAQIYNDAFAALPLERPCSTGDDYVAHLYVLRVKDRYSFREFLKERGIATDVHYPIPDHKQPAYPYSGVVQLDVTESACASVVSLPCFPGLTEIEVKRVVVAVVEYFQQ
ncbi:MAG: DegT/DnrJ/EryC1/StrS family aminotransferase [Glaciimonas sp.]|nr:DegT/DnrJ/EryC1/StrS family aminotransferase [Glaciimonas sp.]